MKYFKAFNKGMKCLGKQYEVGKEYEENGTDVCKKGMMHFCETPFDTLDYYPLVDENGNFSEFAEVEPLDKVIKQDNKCASKKIKIGAKLSFKQFVEAGVGILIEKTKPEEAKDGDGAQIGSSGYGAKIKMNGIRSVAAAIGYKCAISGKIGDWITLAEWKKDDKGWYPDCVKSAQIDGETLKEDVMYHLENGEFKCD